jgi:hypothetical protein
MEYTLKTLITKMERRNFLRLIPVGVAAAIVTPKIFASVKGESVWGPKVEKELKNRLSTLRNTYIAGCDTALGKDSSVIICKVGNGYTWIQKAEWQFMKDWEKQCIENALRYERKIM